MSKPIKTCNLSEIKQLIADANMPKFREKQLLEWLYKHNINSYSEARNLPKTLREFLDSNYSLYVPEIIDKQVSKDGTRKYLLKLSDGAFVETVGIPSCSHDSFGSAANSNTNRLTVCFSTQVGCAMGCAFCATGKEGFTRNLGMGEIIDQVHIVAQDFGCRVSNIVAMGQGEPFLNTQNVFDALKILNSEKFDNIGARHITISTCGIPAGIDALIKDGHQYTLAISLHSATQETRDALMPKVSNYKLDILRNCIANYITETNRRVTFEYLMIDGLNDDMRHLNSLVEFCKPLLSHVNLLPVNIVEGLPFKPSSHKTLDRWETVLRENGIETTIRKSKGSDINGACGQLKNSYKKNAD